MALQLSQSLRAKRQVEDDFADQNSKDMGFPVPHVGIIIEILSATSNLDVITSFSEEATSIFLVTEAVDFFDKS